MRILSILLILFSLFLSSSVQASNGGGQAITFGPFIDTSDNTVYTGIKVEHFAAGTTTDEDCWSDEAKTTPVSTPFVDGTDDATADGVVKMYCDGDYKFVITDTDDVTLHTWDNYKVTQGAILFAGSTTSGVSDTDRCVGTSYPAATTVNRFQLCVKTDASNNFKELGMNKTGSAFSSIISLGYVDPNSFSDLNAAVAASSDKTILIYDTQTLSANLSVPADVGIEVIKGGIIDDGSDYTFISAGPFHAEGFTVFTGFSDGDILWTANKTLKRVNIKWFGSEGDDSTDDYPANQTAATSLVKGQTLFFPPGVYLQSTASQAVRILTSGVTLEGSASDGTIIKPTGAQAGFVIGNNTQAGTEIFGTNVSIVTNGGFDSTTTGWTAIGATLSSTGGGKTGNGLTVDADSGNFQGAYQDLTTVAGVTYIFTAHIIDGTETSQAFYISAEDSGTEFERASGITASTYNEYHLKFEAVSTTTRINLIKNTTFGAAPGTILFDTVAVFPMVSDVTVRNFKFVGPSGGWGVWCTYCDNALIENITGENALGLIAIGNDADDDVTNLTLNNISTSGDMSGNVAGAYNIGLFRVYGANISNINLVNGGTAQSFQTSDSYDVNMNNIRLRSTASGGAGDLPGNGFVFTRVYRHNLNDFSAQDFGTGLSDNFGIATLGLREIKGSVFANGQIQGSTTSAIGLYGDTNTFDNIHLLDNTVDLVINSGASLNKFKNVNMATLTDGSSIVRNQRISPVDTLLTALTGATPSIFGRDRFRLTDTTTITDFTNGCDNQIIYLIAEASLTITDGTNIFLSGSANFAMVAGDTLTLIKSVTDGKWYEQGRGNN